MDVYGYVLLSAVLLDFFCFHHTATTKIYTLSLHDALPILRRPSSLAARKMRMAISLRLAASNFWMGLSFVITGRVMRSEEHTSELQSHSDLVCRLLLEKKKNRTRI